MIFCSAIFALAIAVLLRLLSLGVSGNRRKIGSFRATRQTKSVVCMQGHRLKVQFFLAANAALVLSALALVLVPCVTILVTKHDQSDFAYPLISIVTMVSFAILGLLYSVKKGDMGWQSNPYRTSSLSIAHSKED